MVATVVPGASAPLRRGSSVFLGGGKAWRAEVGRVQLLRQPNWALVLPVTCVSPEDRGVGGLWTC